MAMRVVKHNDLPWRQVRPQLHGGTKRVAIDQRVIESGDNLRVLWTRYQPNLVLERHAHVGDEVIHVMEGEVMLGDILAKAGSTIILEKGTAFGPLIAGKDGTTIYEVFIGPKGSGLATTDPAGFAKVLKERGITLLPEADPATPPARVS